MSSALRRKNAESGYCVRRRYLIGYPTTWDTPPEAYRSNRRASSYSACILSGRLALVAEHLSCTARTLTDNRHSVAPESRSLAAERYRRVSWTQAHCRVCRAALRRDCHRNRETKGGRRYHHCTPSPSRKGMMFDVADISVLSNHRNAQILATMPKYIEQGKEMGSEPSSHLRY